MDWEYCPPTILMTQILLKAFLDEVNFCAGLYILIYLRDKLLRIMASDTGLRTNFNDISVS